MTIIETATVSAHEKQVRAFQKREWEARSLESFAVEMQATVRIITGNPDSTVKYGRTAGGSPAHTDGTHVVLSEQMANTLIAGAPFKDFVRVFKGTTYHEAGHIMFTPRPGDEITRLIRNACSVSGGEAPWNAFMLLEDQRMEMMYVSTYPGTTPYFIVAACNWLLGVTVAGDTKKTDTALVEVWPLMHGRKFLPATVRRAGRAAFASVNGEETTAKVCDLIDEYQTLVFPKDTLRAYDIVMELSKIFPTPPVTNQCGEDHGRTNRGNSNEESPSEDAQVTASEKVKEAQEKDKEEEEEETEKGEKSTESESTEPTEPTESEGDEGDEGDEGEGDSEGSKGDGDGDGEGENEGEDESESTSNGIGAGKSAPTWSEVVEDLKDARDEVISSSAHDRDVDATVKAVNHRNDLTVLNGELAKRKMLHISPDAMGASSAVDRALRQLKLDMDACWNKNESSGRLNIRRAIAARNNPNDRDVFDRWEEGIEEEAGTEVVILLDQSGSMDRNMSRASAAVWALKRAFDKNGVKCTVIGFSDGKTLLYRPQDKHEPTMVPLFETYGATYPDEALTLAQSVIRRSKMTNTVLVVLTDGAWGAPENCNRIIANLRKSGTTTAMFGFNINPTALPGWEHECEIAVTSKTIADLGPFVTSVVSKILDRVKR